MHLLDVGHPVVLNIECFPANVAFEVFLLLVNCFSVSDDSGSGGESFTTDIALLVV